MMLLILFLTKHTHLFVYNARIQTPYRMLTVTMLTWYPISGL